MCGVPVVLRRTPASIENGRLSSYYLDYDDLEGTSVEWVWYSTEGETAVHCLDRDTGSTEAVDAEDRAAAVSSQDVSTVAVSAEALRDNDIGTSLVR